MSNSNIEYRMYVEMSKIKFNIAAKPISKGVLCFRGDPRLTAY